jgi:type II secretion system protein N
MTLTERQRRILRWLGYPLLALVVFTFTLQLTFPYDRVKDKLIEVLSQRYEVQIASAGPTFLPGGMELESMILKSRPTRPGEEPTPILIDRLTVDVGLLSLLLGRVSVDLVAEIGEGSIEGDITASSGELAIEFSTEDLELGAIPGLRDAIGLPMKGGLDAELEVTLPEQRWDQAEGSFTLSCPSCVIGDGKAKIKPKAQGRRTSFFAGEGLTVPALDLGELEGKITFEKGRGTIEKLGAKSKDGDLAIHGTIELGNPFSESRFGQTCMKFRLSDALKQREAQFGNVPNLMGAPLDAEGFSNIIMMGKLAEMRMIAATSCAEGGQAERLDLRAMGGASGGGAGMGRGRPTLPTGEGAEGMEGAPGAPGMEGAPGAPGRPTIPGTDIPTSGGTEDFGRQAGREGEPGAPMPEGEAVRGRRPMPADMQPADNGRPPGEPETEGVVMDRAEMERAAAEARAQRAAEMARREEERRAEEAERNEEGDEGQGQRNGEQQENEE